MVASAFPRIVSDPAILGGKPCIRGTRLSVEFILELVAGGGTREAIAARYPQLTIDDVEEAVRFAARSFSNEKVIATEVTR